MLVEHPVVHAEPPALGHATDHGRLDFPPFAQPQHLGEVVGLHDHEHPLLALGGHHLDRAHARLAAGHARHVDVHSRAGLRRRLRCRARQAGGPEVLHADGEPRIEQRQARLDELLLLERVAHLHGRPLLLGALLEPGRREDAGAADAVAPGRRPQQHGEVPGAAGAGEHEPVVGQHPQTQHVDEWVVAIAVVEHDLAADGRDTDGVAVAADPGHDALEQVPRACVVERAEAERVHERDRARAHREDVADDAADPGRRALVRLDGRRVVVALDSQRHREPVADVDDPRALTRADEYPRRLGRQAAQMRARRLV